MDKKKVTCRNEIEVVGTITSDPVEQNSFGRVTFYGFRLKSKRLSSTYDNYNVRIANDLLDGCDYIKEGNKVKIYGKIQTYIERTEENPEHGHLIISINVESITEVPKTEKDFCDASIRGYLCKISKERKTKDSTITDLCIAINRARYNKSDYLPSIAWNKISKFIQNDAMVGDLISCSGRLQSRKYTKYYESGESQEFEVNEFCLTTCQLEKRGKAHLIKDGDFVEEEEETSKEADE